MNVFIWINQATRLTHEFSAANYISALNYRCLKQIVAIMVPNCYIKAKDVHPQHRLALHYSTYYCGQYVNDRRMFNYIKIRKQCLLINLFNISHVCMYSNYMLTFVLPSIFRGYIVCTVLILINWQCLRITFIWGLISVNVDQWLCYFSIIIYALL